MTSPLREALPPGCFGRAADGLLILLLSAAMTLSGPPAFASDAGPDPAAAQQQPSADSRQPEENHPAKPNDGPEPSAPSTPPDASPDVCKVLAATATANDLPVDFFTRLI